MNWTLLMVSLKKILKTIKSSIIVRKLFKKCRREEPQTLNENSILQNNSLTPIKRTIMSGLTGNFLPPRGVD